MASLLMEDFVIPLKPKLTQAVKITISKFLGTYFFLYVTDHQSCHSLLVIFHYIQ